jgi:beta-lactamase regulating signal transducer with metallopeptidase domain/Tfp pilus assembly protein PilF
MFLLLAKVTLIAAIGRLIIAASPRAAAATRHLIAVATFAAMLLVPIVAASGMRWNWSVLPAREFKAAERMEPAAAATSSTTVDVVAPRPIAAAAPNITPRSVIIFVFLAVTATMLARLLFGMIAVTAITRRAREVADDALLREVDRACERLGVSRLVRVLTSDAVSVPLVWGIRRPALLLPPVALSWSRERLGVVFLHEIAHLRRRDALSLLFTRFVAAIYWFHPLAWSLDRIARRDCEQACDDLVLATGTRPSEYADHLLDIARTLPHRDPFGAVTLAMSRRSQLEGRLLSILQPRARRGVTSMRAAIAVAVVTVIVALPVAAISFSERESIALSNVVAGVAEGVAGGVSSGVEGGVAGGIEGGIEEGVRGGISADEWYSRGQRLFDRGDFQGAAEAYNGAIRVDEYRGNAWYNLACSYARMGDRTRALQTLEQAITHGFTGDGNQLREDDDLASVHGAEFDRITKLADDLSLNAMERGEWRASLARYERVVREHPDLPRAWFNLGFAACESGNERVAVDAFQRCLQANYRPGTVMYNLGCSYARMGQRETAIDWLKKAEAAGFDVAGYAAKDSDLDNVRDDRWLRERIERHEATKKVEKREHRYEIEKQVKEKHKKEE